MQNISDNFIYSVQPNGNQSPLQFTDFKRGDKYRSKRIWKHTNKLILTYNNLINGPMIFRQILSIVRIYK